MLEGIVAGVLWLLMVVVFTEEDNQIIDTYFIPNVTDLKVSNSQRHTSSYYH